MLDRTATETRLLICTQSLSGNVLKLPEMGSFPVLPLTNVRSGYQHSTADHLKTISVIKLWLHPDLWSVQNAYFVLQKIIFPLTWSLIQSSGSNLFIAKVKMPFLLQAPSNPSHREALFNIPKRQ